VRKFIGGADGIVGDVSAYLPLPGSSERFVMFAGPSVTFADRRYMQKEYGVSAAQSLTFAYSH
jgi:outer membrane scaffolding protein for murein synthesis (MipA/OmpV family)